jgi:hypothetical protein
MATAAGQAHEPLWLDDETTSPEDALGTPESSVEERPGAERSSFGPLATIGLSLAIFLPQAAWLALLAYLALKIMR